METDQEDFGYATEECQEGYTTEADFADNEEEDDQEDKSESTTSGAQKLALQTTCSEEEAKSVSSTIEKPLDEELFEKLLTGTLEESCLVYNDFFRSPSLTFEDDLLLTLADTEKVSNKQEECEILPLVEDIFEESVIGPLEEANCLCTEFPRSPYPSFEDKSPLTLTINEGTNRDKNCLIKKEAENQVLVKSNFEIQELTKPKEKVEKQHGQDLPSEDFPVSTSALPKPSLESVSVAEFPATSYRHRILRAGGRGAPWLKMGEDGGQQPLFTAPLQDYLAAGGLEEAWGYLRVLGCLVLGDLSYLLPAEVEALPLLPRRRLMEHVKTLALTPPASPPADAPLDQCLAAHGLHHVLGYVAALGAKCAGDVGYLTEDDLRPLPPVSRRRLLLMGGRMSGHHNSDKGADYLM